MDCTLLEWTVQYVVGSVSAGLGPREVSRSLALSGRLVAMITGYFRMETGTPAVVRLHLKEAESLI